MLNSHLGKLRQIALFDLLRNTALAYGCPKMHVAERSYGSQLQHVGLKYGDLQQWGR